MPQSPVPFSASLPANPATMPVHAPAELAVVTRASLERRLVGWLAKNLPRTDIPLQILVVALAFLLGSFAAANADLWTSLATGRLLAEGKYQFGVDPLAIATEAQPNRSAVAWVNHSWLFSWICYLLYEDAGAVLVVFKAACLAALALVMLSVRPRDRHGWAASLCVLLAIVIVSAHAVLQPIVISYLFLGVTLWILQRAGVLSCPAALSSLRSSRMPWALPLLFALWVNLDGWFILGPVTLFLCIVSLWMSRRFTAGQSGVGLGKLSAVLGVGLLACLANPHHLRALMPLPPELGYLLAQAGNFWPESLVAGSMALHTMRHVAPSLEPSLVSKEFWMRTTEGGNAVGISLGILLVLILASFGTWRSARAGPMTVRLVLTAVFAVLAVGLPSMVPCFAIVGGVVLMLNVQEYLAQRESENPDRIEQHNPWANLLRLTTACLLLGLLFLSWPGWVNYTLGSPASPRRVAWRIGVDPSLKKAAEFLRDMQEQGVLSRGFNLSPDLAGFCAFHTHGLKYFIDQRAELFDPTATSYQHTVRLLETETFVANPLNPLTVDSTMAKEDTWRQVFARHKIDHIVGTGNVARQLMIWTLRFPSGELETIYADGQTFVVAWNQDIHKRHSLRARGLEIGQRWHQEMFGRHERPWPAPLPPPAPRTADPGFWALYAFGDQKPAPPLPEAQMLLDVHFRLSSTPAWTPIYICGWMATFWTQAASAAPGPMVIASLPSLSYLAASTAVADKAPVSGSDIGSPEALLLSIRSARRNVVANPHDAMSYRIMAIDSSQIEGNLENFWARPYQQPNLRANMRKCQFISAFQRYLLLNRFDFQAQWWLGQHFREHGYFDLALANLEAGVQLLGNSDDLNRKQYKAAHEAEVNTLRTEVELRLADFEMQTANLSDLDKIAVAVFQPYHTDIPGGRIEIDPRGMGLEGKAWQIMTGLIERRPSLPENERRQVAVYGVRLALMMGKLADADKLIDPARQPAELLVLRAAQADFRGADEALSALEKLTAEEEKERHNTIGVDLATPFLNLAGPGVGVIAAYPAWSLASKRAARLNACVASKAPNLLLHGVLALEAGKTVSARLHFEESLQAGRRTRLPFPDRGIAQRYLQFLEASAGEQR